MKLITKISRYFFFSSILIFIVISAALYFAIEYSINEETDEQLDSISKRTYRLLRSGEVKSLPPFIEISIVDQTNNAREFKDVQIYTIKDEEAEPFRQLTSFINVNGTNYKVISRISLLEKGNLFLSILITTTASIFLFLLILFFTNRKVSKKVLKDFFDTLKKLETFSIKNEDRLKLSKSTIEEFEQLNRKLLFLSEKASSEYRSLKEFSEEMNHEIQTPITVVKSKLELMLQTSDLSEENLSLLNIALKNLSKLERINRSILLLNKLEHKDLFENSDINISEEIKNIFTTYGDFIESKDLSVSLSLNEDMSLNANQSLINILLSNLVSNAIKHNARDGVINIDLKNDELIISNSGQKPKVNTEKYFERFYKESGSTESVGLGLTIAKKICDLYDIEIRNKFSEGSYRVILRFPL
jgi:signal transduction histidine kinase